MQDKTEIELLLDLAKARALLLHDQATHMPKNAVRQRARIVDVLDQVFGDALDATKESLPESPIQELDVISTQAWEYIRDKQKHPITATKAIDSAYLQLKNIFAQYGSLGEANEVVGWMQDTHAHTVPELDKKVIADSQAALAVFSHRLISKPEIRTLLNEARLGQNNLSAIDQRNLALMHQEWLNAAGLDEALVNNLSQAISESLRAWEKAKPANDFHAWLPYFEKIVDLSRKKGEAIGKELGVTPYQALLGTFNPDLKNETVNSIFLELREKLPGMIATAKIKQDNEIPPLPLPPVPLDVQEKIGRRVMECLGLHKEFARLDVSTHPFSSGEHQDIRITTRYREDDMMPALMGIIHETGHALYSHALPLETVHQPVGRFQSMWVHESQSLFWEYQVANSKEFMEFLAPIIKSELQASCPELDVDGKEWSPENLAKLVTQVKPDFIRVDADEVTYTAHILLRHDLEQRLIDGTLEPKDVPVAWNTGMKQLLGVEVPSDGQGCLQDTHWPSAYIGYFPAYSFGAIGAAQLMEKLTQEMPDVHEYIKTGNFAPIRKWLGERIHRHGSMYSGEVLFERATGEPLSTTAFLKSLEKRYVAHMTD